MGYPTDDEIAKARHIVSNLDKNRPAFTELGGIMSEILQEVMGSYDLGYGNFHSAHEGFAILLEEVDELKAHVWMKQKNRDWRR